MAHRILIIGGGIGGTMTANHLVTKLYPEIRSGKVQVTMLSNSPWHYYKPAFMYVAFNSFFRDELRRPQRSLLRPEVDFHIEEVEEFEFKASRVRCKSGRLVGYDHLIISTGCIPSPERIEGLKEAGDHFYQHAPARQLAEKLSTIEQGRIFITVTFPKTPNVPHQCGIAPIETTLMLDDLLRKRGVRDRVEIVYTYPTVSQLLRNCLFLQKDTCEVLPTIFEQRGIKYQRGFTLDHVDPDRKIAYSAEGKDENFDILMATPPIRAVDAVQRTGISEALDGEGWLPTNHETMQVYGLENVYVLGDTVDLPVSKAGGSCHSQSPVVVNNVASEIRFGQPCDAYDGRVVAIAQMGLEDGMPLWYDYHVDVKPTPPNKLGGLMRKGFNRGLYWSVARGLV
ncbi:NAD(P)/FAD-dependent oxidoreductase [Kerstersia gyiorum]|uniref:NAD(P)/FAD-dependent oxidoreductase n=1 Tax=Kerstersia gyiorum TaxID=206506 RepID=UPI0021506563|nr:FAD/NAD(P)-binding oxidoreductase [Kerstersia gyiorum]MCR4159429.1 NAD(P)/FAD-dependent oxidoreductase [Kerstersia gyiorum]